MVLTLFFKVKYSKNLIKIDVEGYELNVLNSMSTKLCNMSFEWAEEKKKDLIACIERMAALGYTKFAIQCMSDQYDYVPAEHEYQPKDQVLTWVHQTLNENKIHLFGMVHCSF